MTRVVEENLYGRWNAMKQRCINENNKKYKNYGARGITVCDEWLDYKNFKKWSIENGFDRNLTLDRIDTNGDYEPDNCRWTSYKQQENNRTNNRIVSYKNKQYTLSELSDYTGIKSATLSQRLDKGFSVNQAIHRELNYDHIKVNLDGNTTNLKKSCESLGLPYKTIHARIKRGWSINDALNTPVRQGNYK